MIFQVFMTRLMELIGADHSTRVPYERRELALEYIVQVQNWGSSSLKNLAAISQRYYRPVLTLKAGCMYGYSIPTGISSQRMELYMYT